MSKINAFYIPIVVTIAGAIFLGAALTNNSNTNHVGQPQTVQQGGQCCAGHALHTEHKNEPWNEVCPVMGGKVNPNSATVEYNEKYYGFCCPGCIDKFAQELEKYAANLSEDGKKFIK